MYLFQQIEELTIQNSETKRAIGEFLLENRENIQDYNMENIAKLTYTSKPTLVRFAKTLGYSGWKEFIYAFSHETINLNRNADISIDPNFPFSETDDTIQIIENITNLLIQSIKDTVSLIDVDQLNQAAKILNQANRIVIYGTSPNCYYGEIFKRKLLAIGKKAMLAQVGEAGITSQFLTNKDCAVIISYSGNNPNREPTTNIKYFIKNQVPIIGVTNGGKNYLSEYADIVLKISSKERLYSKISNFTTEESIMLLLNLLYSTLFSLEYDKNIKKKISGSVILEPQRQATSLYLSE